MNLQARSYTVAIGFVRHTIWVILSDDFLHRINVVEEAR